MDHDESLTAYVASFVDELAKNGVSEAVISPGSRSTPLALLLAEHPDIRTCVHVDERSAAFLALGMAKAKKQPVALLCTSGTATANYHPAIVEAFYARVPLIVLTADRPRELQDVGAPQTIDQSGMYGRHVKRFKEIDIPENDLSLIAHTRAVCARMVAEACGRPRGPVHLNFPFREPLVPHVADAEKYQTEAPAITVRSGRLTLPDRERHSLADTLRRAKKGIIVCGESEETGLEKAVTQLADRLGFPILADPLSQLRRGSGDLSLVIDGYDAFLKDERAASLLRPDVILRFGAMPVSKALMLWLKKQKAAHFVIDGGSPWRDPAGAATSMIYCDEAWFCRDIIQLVPRTENRQWSHLWQSINETTKRVLSNIGGDPSLSEEKTFLRLSEAMPENAHLFVGSSMPIRELDTFFFAGGHRGVRIFANRGANGIDGVVSTAVGVSLIKKNTVLVLGDLSFFHDMNGLLAARQLGSDLIIVLINNDGGGIFSFLPQASEKAYFETLFGTPHGLDFSHAAHLYGATYRKVKDADEFTDALTHSFSVPGLKIIEVPTKRGENVHRHRRMRQLVGEALSPLFNGVRQ
ncbi:2-succinyl-5-enolpyruvyl-6-hydroxy-3-cyclohexene-1-carboxylic-acid synthase [Sporolactobacillus sp. THM7-7]|nr:2-succinyl-5-enolpyruvyl-6-hydroxy-3-cyclohexene-1-carboxylic-acid synthase [Sporolactobacillus sp. THM7-7]